MTTVKSIPLSKKSITDGFTESIIDLLKKGHELSSLRPAITHFSNEIKEIGINNFEQKIYEDPIIKTYIKETDSEIIFKPK